MPERLLMVVSLLTCAVAVGLTIRAMARARAARHRGEPAPADLRARLSAESPTVVYFYGPHCGSCEQQARALEHLGEDGLVSVLALDTTEEPSIARALGVATVPSTALIGRDGRVRQVNLGYRSGKTIEAQLSSIG